MTIYTLYPTRPDGACLTIVAYEAGHDAQALDHAQSVSEHPTSDHVQVFDGERRVGQRPHGAGLPVGGPGAITRAIAESRRAIEASKELLEQFPPVDPNRVWSTFTDAGTDGS